MEKKKNFGEWILGHLEHHSEFFDSETRRIFEQQRNEIILDKQEKNESKKHSHFEFFLIALIFLSVLMIFLETFHSLADQYSILFFVGELVFTVLFSIEYILRVYTAKINVRYSIKVQTKGTQIETSLTKHPRLKYITSPLGIIDLLSIIPFWLSLIHFYLIPLNFLSLRVLRIFRLFRVLEIAHFTDAFDGIITVLKNKRHHLLISIFTLLVLIVVAAGVIFEVEHSTTR